MVSRVSSAGRYWGLVTLAGSVLFLGGCKDYALLNLQGTAIPPPKTQNFAADLADEYQVLAEFAASEAHKEKLAGIFYKKSEEAANGVNVVPEHPEDYKIPAFAQAELHDAREHLMTGLVQANVPDNARMLAMAQVKFDCWLAYQPYQKKQGDYIGCRDAFHQAMAYVDFSKQIPKKSPANKDITSETQTIHFINDTMTLDQGAHAAIAALAEEALANEGAGVLLVGYSKTIATIEDTSNNAVRRIIAVRNALYQNGVDPDLVEIEFVKGGDPQDVDMELLPGAAEKSS